VETEKKKFSPTLARLQRAFPKKLFFIFDSTIASKAFISREAVFLPSTKNNALELIVEGHSLKNA